MTNPIPTDVFITTLTQMLNQDRDLRASDLARHSKDQAMRFLSHRPESHSTRLRRADPTRTAEAPDCVSFFSNTLKGATP